MAGRKFNREEVIWWDSTFRFCWTTISQPSSCQLSTMEGPKQHFIFMVFHSQCRRHHHTLAAGLQWSLCPLSRLLWIERGSGQAVFASARFSHLHSCSANISSHLCWLHNLGEILWSVCWHTTYRVPFSSLLLWLIFLSLSDWFLPDSNTAKFHNMKHSRVDMLHWFNHLFTQGDDLLECCWIAANLKNK